MEATLLDYAGAAEILGMKLGTLYALVHKGRIPHIRLGRRLVRFSRPALQEWLDHHAVTGAWVDGDCSPAR